MSKKVKSARGQIVDFDLLKLKSEITSQPAPSSVHTRERFISEKLQRRRAAQAEKTEKVVESEKPTEVSQEQYEKVIEAKKQPRKVNKQTDTKDDAAQKPTEAASSDKTSE